jgi:hypothetical protein
MTNSGVAIGCGIPFFPSDYSVEMYSVLIGEAVRETLSSPPLSYILTYL